MLVVRKRILKEKTERAMAHNRGQARGTLGFVKWRIPSQIEGWHLKGEANSGGLMYQLKGRSKPTETYAKDAERRFVGWCEGGRHGYRFGQ